tara:strand:+ start:345 stop:515 length:171 start_codon:yes stop_codon:yes gene_type:complete
MNDTLKKELQELISNEFINEPEDKQDMTPIMSQIYNWGINNITQKEMKKIIKRYKK